MLDKKAFAAGSLTALFLTAMVSPVSATVGKVTKELEYRNISVSLDGEKLDLRDAQGNTVEPFMFGGTNYLPARALAEALGLTVAWDGSTSTVVLTTPGGNIVETDSVETEKQLFSREHIRIYFCGFVADENGNQTAKLRVQNDSDFDVQIRARDTTVQGVSVAVTNAVIVKSCETLDWIISLSQDDLSRGGITSVQSVKTRFSCSGEDYAGNKVSFETGTFVLG